MGRGGGKANIGEMIISGKKKKKRERERGISGGYRERKRHYESLYFSRYSKSYWMAIFAYIKWSEIFFT